MAHDGKNIQQLTNEDFNETTPTFSPDGKKIAFVSDRDGNDEVYIMNADGSGQVNISQHPEDDIHPHWHPSQDKIIFNSTRDVPKAFELYEYGFLDQKIKRLTYNNISETYASWSPDGSKITFVKWSSESGNVYYMDYPSLTEHRITSHKEFDGWPSWSSDGARVFFASFRRDPAQIFSINIDGKSLKQHTDNEEENARPHIQNGKLLYNGMKNGTMNIYMLLLNQKEKKN